MVDRVAIILAAGISSRMDTATHKTGKVPKVLHEVCGRPMLAYVLDVCRQIGVKKIYVVVGFGAEQVKKRFADDGDIVWVYQVEQKGTADAVLCCKEYLKNFEGETLILCGDGPLVRVETLEALIDKHDGQTSATLATAILERAAGYGRIVRDEKGNIERIVEDKDCTAEQLKIKEVNPSYYLFNNKRLFEALAKVRPDNVQKEYYLTDVLSIMLESGQKVAAVTAVSADEAISVNTREQLNEVNEIMRRRLNGKSQIANGKSRGKR